MRETNSNPICGPPSLRRIGTRLRILTALTPSPFAGDPPWIDLDDVTATRLNAGSSVGVDDSSRRDDLDVRRPLPSAATPRLRVGSRVSGPVHWIVRASLCGFAGLGCLCAGEPTTIYQRAQIESAVGGNVRVGARYEVVLDLPDTDCIGGDFTCSREQRFGQLYRIEFTLHALRRREGLQQESAPSSAGTIHIAADIERAQELEFEAALDEAIAQLHGDSFRHPFAGWEIGRPPLGQQALLGPSNRTAWICIEHGATESLFRITPKLDRDQVVSVITGGLGKEASEAGCAAMRESGSDDGARSVATPYDISALVRTEIEVSVDWFPGSGSDSAWQPLPAEMEYTKVESDLEVGTSSMGYDGNARLHRMSRTSDGVKTDLTLGEFEVRPPRSESAAWVTRWSISTYAQSFGSGATEEGIGREELWAVALPIVDPLAESGVVPADPGADRLDRIAGDFDRAARLDVETLAAAFHSTVGDSLEQGDWMLIYCSPSREPEYGIARYYARSAAQNGTQLCDAVARLYR